MVFSDALMYSLVGILVVFFALALLMVIVVLLRKFTSSEEEPISAQDAPEKLEPEPLALGSAGEVKLYDTDPREAAMIMAIVADKLNKPLNELRFISIKEIKQDEV